MLGSVASSIRDELCEKPFRRQPSKVEGDGNKLQTALVERSAPEEGAAPAWESGSGEVVAVWPAYGQVPGGKGHFHGVVPSF